MHRPPPHPMDEEERLEALRKYRILDTAPEPQFDRVAAIARRQFDAPIGLVTFMDSDRNFLKARGDLPISEAPRDTSFCAHTSSTTRSSSWRTRRRTRALPKIPWSNPTRSSASMPARR